MKDREGIIGSENPGDWKKNAKMILELIFDPKIVEQNIKQLNTYIEYSDQTIMKKNLTEVEFIETVIINCAADINTGKIISRTPKHKDQLLFTVELQKIGLFSKLVNLEFSKGVDEDTGHLIEFSGKAMNNIRQCIKQINSDYLKRK